MQLQDAVVNDNITDYYNSLKIIITDIYDINKSHISIKSSDDVKLLSINSYFLDNNGTQFTECTMKNEIYYNLYIGTHIINNKDKITSLRMNNSNENNNKSGIKFDLSQLNNMDNLIDVSLVAYGDVSVFNNIKNKSCTMIALSTIFNDYNAIYGDIAAFSDYINIKYLYFNTINGLYGDISSLSKLTKLIDITLGSTSITGTIESFVQGQRSNGRTTCNELLCKWFQTSEGITFNGEPCESTTTGTCILSWTETTITYNDVTITA